MSPYGSGRIPLLLRIGMAEFDVERGVGKTVSVGRQGRCSGDLPRGARHQLHYAARACVRACVGHEAAFLKRMGIDQRSVHSPPARRRPLRRRIARSEEHTSELQSLMRISYAVFCLKKKKTSKLSRTNKIKKYI